jgi:hypothetical protein
MSALLVESFWLLISLYGVRQPSSWPSVTRACRPVVSKPNP